MQKERTTKSEEFGRIGGTTVSAIVGQNPWETPHSAYLKLRREVEPTPDNEVMARGRRFEPIVADIFQGVRPEYRVAHNRKGTDEPELYEHEKYPYLIGHPDRLLYDAENGNLVAGLEIKTSNLSNTRNWGLEGTDAKATADMLRGNTCGAKPTSCTDQLAKALRAAIAN